MKKLTLALLSILLLATTVIKFAEVWRGNFPFTMDQGRDMVDMRNMYVTMTPRLVGPTTSINGVMLGPFWYYFNFVPFVVSHGNPSAVVYWQIIWYQIGVIFLWWVLKKKSFTLAAIISVVLMLTPTSFNSARYFWNANSMPIFTIFYFATFYQVLFIPRLTNFLILGLLSGLGMQIEAAFGVILFPFALVYLLAKKTKFQKVLYLCLGFGLTLIPQIAFELKHRFIMTKVLLGEFTGTKTQMLGDKLVFSERLAQRWDHFHSLLLHSNHLPPNYLIVIYSLSLLVLVWYLVSTQKQKTAQTLKEVWVLPIYFVIFAGLFYLKFSQSLKIWYTLGLSVPLAIYFGSMLTYLWENPNVLSKLVCGYVLYLTVFYGLKSQLDYTRYVASKPSDDRSNLSNEIRAIDWVYKKAEGKGFKLYSYLPSVYDFPYNYIVWWYATPKYGYQPAETSYLPNQPEYIPNLNKVWKKKNLDITNDLTFLIIEEDLEIPARQHAWEGNFSKLCLQDETIFPWGTKVKQLSACPSR